MHSYKCTQSERKREKDRGGGKRERERYSEREREIGRDSTLIAEREREREGKRERLDTDAICFHVHLWADSPIADEAEVEKSFWLSRPDGWVINRKMKKRLFFLN